MARAYRERFPDLPVLYVTGYAEQMQPVPGGIIISKLYRMAQVIGVLGISAAVELAREIGSPNEEHDRLMRSQTDRSFSRKLLYGTPWGALPDDRTVECCLPFTKTIKLKREGGRE